MLSSIHPMRRPRLDPRRLDVTLVIGLAVLALAALYLPGLLGHSLLSFRDNLSHHLGWRLLWRDALLHGQLPETDPLIVAGSPFLADPNAMPLYPLNLVYLLLPPAPALALFYLFHQLLLATGGWVLLRRQGRSRGSALAGAAVLAGGGLAFSQLAFTNAFATFAWAPWLIATAVRLPDRLPAVRRRAVAAGIVGAMAWLAGEPVLAALAWIAWGIAAVGSLPAHRSGWRTVATLLVAPLLAVLLAAPQLAPAASAYADSRRHVLGLAQGSIAADAFTPRRWPEIVLPHLYGSPGPFAPDGFWARPSFGWLRYEVNLNVGTIALVLLTFGIGASRVRPWAVALLAAVAAAACPAAIAGLAGIVPPVAGFRYAIKLLVLAQLAAAPLIARGFAAARRRRASFRRRAVAVAVAMLLLAGPLAFPDGARDVLGFALPASAGNLRLPGVTDSVAASVRRDLATGVIPLIVAAVAPRYLILPALVAQLLVGGSSMLMWDDSARYTDPPPVVADLGSDRRVLEDIAFQFDRLHDSGDPVLPAPTRRTRLGFAQLWRFYGAPWGVSYRGVFGPDGMEPWWVADCARRLAATRPEARAHAARQLGAAWILAAVRLPASEDVEAVESRTVMGEPLVLHRLRRPPPAAWLARREVSSPWRRGGWELLLDPGLEPGRDAVVSGRPSGRRVHAAGQVEVLQRSASSWTVSVMTSSDGLLVIDQAFSHAWRADVDGAPARPELVNLWQLGVRVPPGTHTVRVTANRAPLRMGLLLLLLGALLSALLAGRRSTTADRTPSCGEEPTPRATLPAP